MRTIRSSRVSLAALTLLCASLAVGCASSPDARFFALSSLDLPPPGAPAADALQVIVEEVEVPALVDRPQLVSQLDAHELSVDDYARWGESLSAMLTRVLVDDLARLFGSARVAARHGSSTVSDSSLVRVVVSRLDARPGRQVLLEARVSVVTWWDTKTPHLLPFSLAVPWSDARPEGMVAAVQQAVDELARQVAALVREAEATRG
ncbi:MAG: membrane integrity-associated transporter subunit PqiC [Planctomycetes bacterium]|nr:membrane integrity-associated transporter subunit PqiC [Planctomycetota bacterium]